MQCPGCGRWDVDKSFGRFSVYDGRASLTSLITMVIKMDTLSNSEECTTFVVEAMCSLG